MLSHKPTFVLVLGVKRLTLSELLANIDLAGGAPLQRSRCQIALNCDSGALLAQTAMNPE